MYEPLLAKMIRSKNGDSDDDRLQSLLLHFLETIQVLGPNAGCTNAPGYIRTALEHSIAKKATRARHAPPFAPYDEATMIDRNAPFRENLAFSAVEIPGGRELAEAIAVGGRKPALRRFVRAAHPHLPARRARALTRELESSSRVLVRYMAAQTAGPAKSAFRKGGDR